MKLQPKNSRIFLGFFLIWIIFLASCSSGTMSQFEVQHPARVNVPRDVKKVFIRSDLIADVKDTLKLKKQVLEVLARELNRMGRFEVSVVKTFNENIVPAGTTIAVIQGEVISGGEVDHGQFTDIATCKGGVGGRVASAASAAATDHRVTFDSRAFVCQQGDLKSDAIEAVGSKLLSLAGVSQEPPVNQVVRVYKYKNLSLFAQVNLSFTVIGNERKTLAIRAEAGSFGRHVIDRDSYRNVMEARPNPVTQSMIQRHRTPIIPILLRDVALVHKTKPRQDYYRSTKLPKPSVRDLPAIERMKILNDLVENTITNFVRTVSPYKVMIETEIATNGNTDVEQSLRAQKWTQARNRIENLSPSRRNAADWFNLGLSYEGGAIGVEDYEDARRFYTEALNREPSNKLYASAIGRIERRLNEYRVLQSQIKKDAT